MELVVRVRVDVLGRHPPLVAPLTPDEDLAARLLLQALPLGGRSLDDDDTLEQRELLALYRLQEQLEAPMAEQYAMKEKFLLTGIVVCPTLEELYAALNSAKARLLGPTSLRIAMPQGGRSTVAGRAKKASPTTRKMQRRRSEAPDTYRLTVNVLSAKLREGSSRVYAWDASRIHSSGRRAMTVLRIPRPL